VIDILPVHQTFDLAKLRIREIAISYTFSRHRRSEQPGIEGLKEVLVAGEEE
jgi:hypothetical protein